VCGAREREEAGGDGAAAGGVRGERVGGINSLLPAVLAQHIIAACARTTAVACITYSTALLLNRRAATLPA
jgi:hypothetical protein